MEVRMANPTNRLPFLMQQKSKLVDDLMQKPFCFLLITQIARRAKRTDDFNLHNLEIGESLIGDYKSIGATEQQYRTAKRNLQNWGFATFKSTNKGTVAKLLDSRVYDINQDEGNEQDNEPTTDEVTDEQRANNEPTTTNKKYKKERSKEYNNIVESQFNEFWDKYNHKKSKPLAEKSFEKALKSESFNKIMQGLDNYIKSRGVDSKFWKHPATWLNQECWNDELLIEPNNNLSDQVNKLLGDNLIIKIDQNKSSAKLYFKSKNAFEKMKIHPKKDEAKTLISKSLSINNFEFSY